MELWLEHQKIVIWLKNRKYLLVIEREIIEASGGFYVTRLSSEQYGRNNNLSYMSDVFKYGKVRS